MTRTRTAVIVAGTIAAVAVLTWVIVAPARHQAAPVVAAPAPADSTWPRSSAGASPPPDPPSAAAPSAPGESGAPGTAAATPPAATAEPFVQSFAGQPGVQPHQPVPSPTRTISVAANIDGCDHAYGLPTQCVPWTFPAGTTDKCAWLAEHGYTELTVVAADRQKLDPDGDKIACDN